jgi:hypothetical protein
MNATTCAACDCTVDSSAVSLTLGGKTVEVCCKDCAGRLERSLYIRSIQQGGADMSASANRSWLGWSRRRPARPTIASKRRVRWRRPQLASS